jgi:hypothetical protein
MQIKKTSRLFVSGFVLLLVLNILSVSALTASIGNAKAVVSVELNPSGKTVVERTLKVINSNDIPVNITLFVDPEIKDYIEILNETFILDAGKEYSAGYRIILNESGVYEGNINVLFTEVGKKDGVVLPANLIISAEGVENQYENFPVVIIFVTLILIAIVLFIIYNIKTKKGGKKEVHRRTE